MISADLNKEKFNRIFRIKRFEADGRHSKEVKELIEKFVRENITGSYSIDARIDLKQIHFKEILNIWIESLIESFKYSEITIHDKVQIQSLFYKFCSDYIENEKDDLLSSMLSYGHSSGSLTIKTAQDKSTNKLNIIKSVFLEKLIIEMDKHNTESEKNKIDHFSNTNYINIINESKHVKSSPLKISVIGGVIVAAIAIFIFTPIKEILLPENGTIEKDSPNKILPKDSLTNISSINIKPENILSPNVVEAILQSYRTQEYFNGDILITLNTTLQYANEKIELKLNKKGEEGTTSRIMNVGDKTNYYNYEILFIEARNNLSTYDVQLKIIKM